MISITNASTSELLVSLANAKAALDTTSTGADDTLTNFIKRASVRIENYCGQQLLLRRYEVRLPSYGGTKLYLPHRFIRTLFTARDSSDTGQDELSSTGYRLDTDQGYLYRDEGFAWSAQFEGNALVHEPSAGNEYNRWYFDYSAGFIPADGKDSGSTWDGTTSTGSTVPLDLQDAAITLIRRSWISRGRDPEITSEKIGELAISYGGGKQFSVNSANRGIPDEVANMLSPYVRI